MDETKLKKLLGLRIKQYCNKLGLIREELGEKIDRSQRQVSLIELGSSFPNPITLTNITNVFNCSMKDLFDFEPVDRVASQILEKYPFFNRIKLTCGCKDFNEHYMKCIKG